MSGIDLSHIKMNWDNQDTSEAMTMFKQQMQMVFRRKKITDKQDQADEILLRVGEIGLRKFNSWGLTAKDAADPDVIWEKFEEYGNTCHNFQLAGLQIITMRQNENEPIDEYMMRTRIQAKKCKYRKAKIEN